MKVKILFIYFSLLLSSSLVAQSGIVSIQKIEVLGNKKTKDHIVIRELDFSVGDTIHISNLGKRIERNRLFLMNTGLFGQAKINLKNWNTQEGKADVEIEIKEFWFIYPFPIFELGDRNFNEWWQTYNHDLGRINYGVRFYHTNLTGRRDLLKLVTQFGFLQKYEVEYLLPGINKKQTLGVFTNILYTRNKEIAYNTLNDTLQYYRDENTFLLKRIRAGLGLRFRPKLNVYYNGMLNFHHNTIDERVDLELNPDFFSNGLKQRYFSLSFNLNIDQRDIRPFPLNGYQVLFSFQKDGFGIFDEYNAGFVNLALKKYFSLNEKWSVELIGKGQMGLVRKDQPYFNYRSLGYKIDFIRGYELYVIDGLDYAYTKTSLRFELVNFIFQWGKIMPIKQFRRMPIKWYLSINNDFGYVNDPFFKENNSLRNKLLWGGGLGLNIVVFYDKVIQLEYSMNKLGERGFFLHWELNF